MKTKVIFVILMFGRHVQLHVMKQNLIRFIKVRKLSSVKMINCLIKARSTKYLPKLKRDESHIQESQGKDAYSSTTTTQKTSEFNLFLPLSKKQQSNKKV